MVCWLPFNIFKLGGVQSAEWNSPLSAGAAVIEADDGSGAARSTEWRLGAAFPERARRSTKCAEVKWRNGF